MNAKFNIIKRGYDPSEVTEYIESLESVIKGYKEKESAIKNAIVSAQVAADSIVKNAKNEASQIRSEGIKRVHAIINSVKEQRILLDDFSREYSALIDKYLYQVKETDIERVSTRISALEQCLNGLVDSDRDMEDVVIPIRVRKEREPEEDVPSAPPRRMICPRNEEESDSLTPPNPFNRPL
ncbi:MAG: DivIVA domain-containing protein [Clostridiales bacterium]|nr:DivIVA domain-containing protein [Clostridiales bacterium]